MDSFTTASGSIVKRFVDLSTVRFSAIVDAEPKCYPSDSAKSWFSSANFVAVNARRSTSPPAICIYINLLKLDKLPAVRALFYLQRWPPGKDTAAPWKNLFERAVDATACRKQIAKLASVAITDCAKRIVVDHCDCAQAGLGVASFDFAFAV